MGNRKAAALDVVKQIGKTANKSLSPLTSSKKSTGKPQHRKHLNSLQSRSIESVPYPKHSQVFSDISSLNLSYEAFDVPDQPTVPKLANNLDRVLFSPGINFLKDPRTNVYNYDSRLEKIISITDFDFNRIPPYIPAGKDSRLARLAGERQFRYIGSTSSLTSILTHLHHALSHGRPPQILKLSKYFPGKITTFSAAQRAPTSFWLKKFDVPGVDKDVYAVSAANSGSSEQILTLLGQAMEAMLTTECTEFESWSKSRKVDSLESSNECATVESTYNYTSCGSFLMRSQLDCHDSRLPGTGMFDLKTRACCAIRHDVDYAQIHDGSDYHILKLHGQYESFEREYFELVRSALLKYSLQARIGRMDGIFVAYHSVRRLFGFEYLPLEEIDKVFHTAQVIKPRKRDDDSKEEAKDITKPQIDEIVDEVGELKQYDLESQLAVAPMIADAEFKHSMEILQNMLDMLRREVLTGSSPDLNIAIHCDVTGSLLVVARPGKESNDRSLLDMDALPEDARVFSIQLQQYIDGVYVPRNVFPSLTSVQQDWRVRASIVELSWSSAIEKFDQTRQQLVQQVLTSEPRTDELPTEEELAEMRRNLPEASPFQKILRAFERKGRVYGEWDAVRPKL